MTPITVRQRLKDYEFTDEQEITLTLELLARIEKDIDDLKTTKTREGFSLYVGIAGLATTVFILLGELNKLGAISFSKIGVIFFAGILILKIPWAIYQLITFDHATQKRQKPGRFFWSNDFFFENRPTGVFQATVFLVSLVIIFLLRIPLWVRLFTGISFFLYIFIIGLLFVMSFKKEAYVPTGANKKAIVGLPILYLVFTIVSIAGLFFQMTLPTGDETRPYLMAGLLLAAVFFVDMLIRLSTPSLLLEKLQTLRYDIIFLKANLQDAWIRYDIHINGNDISEELRVDMDDIIQGFNSLDFQQSLKIGSLTAIQEESQKLQTREELTETDFEALNRHTIEFFLCVQAIDGSLKNLNPRLSTLADQVHKISRATQEWKRADEYHNYIQSRFASFNEKEAEITRVATEADEKIAYLKTKLIKEN